MATTPTTRVTSLARSHRLDIDTATYPAVNYEQLMGLEELKLVEEIRVEEDEGYSDDGAMRETNTGYNWRLEGKLAYSTNLAGDAVDTVHAFLRTKFKAHRAGRIENAEFGVRFYDRDGLDSGHEHEGRVYVKQWSMPGGKGRDVIDIVLQGQGSLTDITNPLGTLTPEITSLDPATGPTAGGNLVSIYGSKFTGVTGATGVKFGANNATSYVLVNDTRIVAIAPAGLAGTVEVTVTTPDGTNPTPGTTANDYVYA